MAAKPMYLVTGAGGGVGGVSRQVVDRLLAANQTVRAMVHREDGRAEALRAVGAQVVVGDLRNPVDVAAALQGVDRVFFSMSVSASYLEATTVMCALAAETANLDVLVNMSQMTVSQMTPTSTEESSQQRLHWLAEHVIDWSPIPAVQIRPTVFLENPLFTVLAARIDPRPTLCSHCPSAPGAHRRLPPAMWPIRSLPSFKTRLGTSAPSMS